MVKEKTKTLRSLWKLALGVALMLAAGYLLLPVLHETMLTVQTLVGITFVAVGASVLAEVF